MYKELCVIIVVLILVLFFNDITQDYTKECVESVNSQLNGLKGSILEEKYDKTSDLINEILNNWKDRKEKLEYFIEHDELEKVETELMSLKANIEIKEYEHGVPDIQKAMFTLNHIQDKFAFRVQNIF